MVKRRATTAGRDDKEMSESVALLLRWQGDQGAIQPRIGPLADPSHQPLQDRHARQQHLTFDQPGSRQVKQHARWLGAQPRTLIQPAHEAERRPWITEVAISIDAANLGGVFPRGGLLKASFVPDRAQRELRELVRYRTSLTQERTAACNRLQKVLEGANIKLASVATDILGRSGREMLSALVGRETDPTVLAELAQGKLRQKLPELRRAPLGQVGAPQRLLLGGSPAPHPLLFQRVGS